MQGKKHSQVGPLASIFDAAAVNFYQKDRRNADYQQPLGQPENHFARWWAHLACKIPPCRVAVVRAVSPDKQPA